MKVKTASANPDPFVKRKNERNDNSGAKKHKTSAEATCPLSHMPYEDQLKQKESEMEEILKSFGKELIKINKDLKSLVKENGLPCDFQGIKASPEPNGYRNKSEFAVGKNSSGDIVVGFRLGSYSDGSVEIGEISDLPHVPERVKVAAKTFEEFIKQSKFKTFNPEHNSGHFRQLMVRSSDSNSEVMLVPGIYSTNLTSDEVVELKENLKEFYANYNPEVFVCNSLYYQDLKKREAGQVCNPVEHLSGSTHISDVIHGLTFRVSPLAFFQINTPGAGVLYQQAIDLAAPKPNSTILDICCGTGTIALCFAKHCKQVVGVEIIPEAIKDAEFNAEKNNVKNCKFYAGNADDYIQSMVREVVYGASTKDVLDIVAIVDPPRSGLHSKSISAIRSAGAIKRLVYVACNPKSAQRNWLDLCKPESKNYKGDPFVPKVAVAVDMFPHTVHTEMVILFERPDNKEVDNKHETERASTETVGST